MDLALPLGADVPVFVFGQSAFAQGVGEDLSAVALPSAPIWWPSRMPACRLLEFFRRGFDKGYFFDHNSGLSCFAYFLHRKLH